MMKKTCSGNTLLSLLRCLFMVLCLFLVIQIPVLAQNVSVTSSDLAGNTSVTLVAQGTCGEDVTWTLDDQYTLTIAGSGFMRDYAYNYAIPWYKYRCEIKAVTISNGVTGVSDWAFYDCTGLTSVTIPESVTSIGDDAFYNCSSLQGVYIYDLRTWLSIKYGNYASSPTYYAKNLYIDNELLTDITIPEGVTSIGSYAFSGCTCLTSITIPEGVNSIGDYAFSGCTGLTSITISQSVTSIGSSAFNKCTNLQDVYIYDLRTWLSTEFGNASATPMAYAKNLYVANELLTDITIPEGFTSIGSYTFYGCSGLTSITIPEGVTSIGSYAFSGCSGLTSITIPEGVTSIGSYAFSRCSGLTSITIPEGVTSIGDYAFSGCTGLTSVNIPQGVTRIGYYTFGGCSSLVEISIPESVTSVDSSAFSDCTSLTNIQLPDKVAYIGSLAFYRCRSLVSITIPKDVKYIEEETFYGCWSLKEINLPEGLLSIGQSAFSDCTTVTNITLPESLVIIESFAFSYCRELTEITIPANVIDIKNGAFMCCYDLDSITFLGDAPAFGSSCFYEVSATAYYDCIYTQWSTTIKQTPSSTIKWVGHQFEGLTHQDATCTQDEMQIQYCLKCGERNVQSIPNTAKGHNFKRVTAPATCLADGFTSDICTECGEVDTTNTSSVPALGHTFNSDDICTACGCSRNIVIDMRDSYQDSWNRCAIRVYADGALLTTATITTGGSDQEIITYDPRVTYTFKWVKGSYPSECTFDILVNGEMVYTGKGSNYSDGETFYTLESKCNHIYTEVVTAQSCVVGKFITYTCIICGKSHTEQLGNAAGHNYYTRFVRATCDNDGSVIETCIVCGDAQVQDIPTTGHSYTTVTLDATCIEDGSITEFCTSCAAREVLKIPATGHSYTTETIDATCSADGSVIETCSNCGGTQVRIIPATGHSCTTVTVEATCTIDGSVTEACVNCGNTDVRIIPATGHSYTTETINATCSIEGSVTNTCANCGDTTVQVIPATGHDYSATIIASTCTENGNVCTTCKRCDYMINSFIPATGHSFENGTCTNCGEADPDYVNPVVVPTLTLKAPALEFKDMIKVIAFYTAENTQDVVEMGMLTYTAKVDVVDINTAAHVIPGAEYETSSGRYFSSSQGIHAKYLGDTVYLACYAKLTDGSYVYTKLAGYGPLTYATNQLNKSTDMKLKQLCAAMLNYGAAAQNYFGYNTDVLANSTLTAEQIALPEAYTSDMVGTVPAADAAKQGEFANNKGFSVRKPAVSFEGAFSINYFFTPAYTPVDGITLYYWSEADFNAADVLTTANTTGSIAMEGEGMGQYRADIVDIAAKDLANAVYVAAVYSDGTTTWTSGVLGYSIGAYCSSMAKNTDAMAELAKATAVYGYHAKQYFG